MSRHCTVGDVSVTFLTSLTSLASLPILASLTSEISEPVVDLSIVKRIQFTYASCMEGLMRNRAPGSVPG